MCKFLKEGAKALGKMTQQIWNKKDRLLDKKKEVAFIVNNLFLLFATET